MKIQELMTKPATTCLPGDSLSVAAQRMWDHDCGALPVVGNDGKLIGMLTDRDICMSAWSHGRPLDGLRVDEAMAKEVFSVNADDDVARAEDLMAEKQVRRVPVVDADNRPVGLVSTNDLMREVAKPGSRIKDQVTHLLRTFAAICRPRRAEKAAAA